MQKDCKDRKKLSRFNQIWQNSCKAKVADAQKKTVEPHQPFLLDGWDAVARLCQDQDFNLPSQLKAGVPTGVVEPIQPSGVWEATAQEDTGQDDLDPSILQVHEVPWKSGLVNEGLTLEFMLKDVAAGHAFELPGGEAEARAWR